VKDTPGIRFCDLEATPWGNELIEELAEKALAAENLGRHSATDVLTVSFSSNDYVATTWGRMRLKFATFRAAQTFCWAS